MVKFHVLFPFSNFVSQPLHPADFRLRGKNAFLLQFCSKTIYPFLTLKKNKTKNPKATTTNAHVLWKFSRAQEWLQLFLILMLFQIYLNLQSCEH